MLRVPSILGVPLFREVALQKYSKKTWRTPEPLEQGPCKSHVSRIFVGDIMEPNIE